MAFELRPSYRGRKRHDDEGAEQKSKQELKADAGGGSFQDKVKGIFHLGGSSEQPKEVAPLNTLPAPPPDDIKHSSEKEIAAADEDEEKRKAAEGPLKEDSKSRRPGGSKDQESDDPATKRRKSDRDDRGSARSSEDSRGGKRPWTFRHTKEGSVIDDEEGMSRLFRHFKPIAWDFPPFKEMSGRDDYSRTCSLFGQAFSAMNKSFIRYEERIKERPSQATLDQVEVTCREAQARFEETRAKADALGQKIASQREEILLLEKERNELKVECSISDSRMVALVTERNDYKDQVLELTAQIEGEKRRAKRAGKREMIEAYQSILELVKAKFEKRRSAEKSLARAQEIQANIDLLEEIIEGRIQDLAAEKDRLVSVELPRRKAKLQKRAVSDFSLSKLPLPQVSEGSNEPMDVDPVSGVPQAIDPYGTNIPDPQEDKEAGKDGNEGSGEEAEDQEHEDPKAA